MAARAREFLLLGTVFCAGAVVLILEILGAKLLAPFFGSTQYVWSALIAVTLLALSVGYSLGGRVADRYEPYPMLNRGLVVAGWLVLSVPLARLHVLPFTADFGIRLGSLLAALILLALPLTILGAVAPLAAKTAVRGLDTLGLRVGTLYALSTLGSLAGALATGFLLIPLFGVSRILHFSALLLFLPALLFWLTSSRGRARTLFLALTLAGIAAALAGIVIRPHYPQERAGDPWKILDKADSAYGEIKVVQRGAARILLLSGSLQSAIEIESRHSLFEYAPAMAALLKTAHPQARRILIIGLGGGILAEKLTADGMTVESIEIDPEVIRAARRFFLENRDLPVFREDGRTFLSRAKAGSYDAIIMDAYTAETPPTHLLTEEAYRLVSRALAPGGIGIANVISKTQGREGFFTRCMGHTLRRVFPWVEAYAIVKSENPANVLYVFGHEPRRLAKLAPVPGHPLILERMAGMLENRLDLADEDGVFAFTDDFNPAETMLTESLEYMRAHLRALIPAWVLLG